MKKTRIYKPWLIALCLSFSLLFPTASITTGAATSADEKNNTTTIYYVIKGGDTLSKIASKYNTTVTKLKQLNNLKSNLIISGRKLIVSKTTMPYDSTVTASNPLSTYGKFTISGMAYKDYKEAMAAKWSEIITEGEPTNIDIDLTKIYTYTDMQDIMINLAKYQGVKLYKIGETKEGRDLYSLAIDFQSDLSLVDGEIIVSEEGKSKEILLSTGQVHAREFAGSIFILKEFNDLIEQAQTDVYMRALLENVIHIAIPCVNPDGREAITNGGSVDQKTNANGVDLNRNFPSLNSGQLEYGNKLSNDFLNVSGNFFGGKTLGSEAETQAVMKWLDVFVPIADSLVDYHQQGGGTYSRRDWDTIVNQDRYTAYAVEIRKHINTNVSKNKYVSLDAAFEGLVGTGGTVTDYAASVATGSNWSIPYGRCVITNEMNVDIPLMVFNSLENVGTPLKQLNPDFVTVTLEIGRSKSSLCYNSTARKLIAEEYVKYNYGEFLTFRSELSLGAEKVKMIKSQK